MKGYDKYQTLMAIWADEYMRPFVNPEKRNKVPERSKAFLTKLFFGFMEISGTVEALKLSEVLISIAPPRSNKIKRDDYLRYHINAYLQEVYILKERLNSYATHLKRVYLKTEHNPHFERNAEPLFYLVKEGLANWIHTRGHHVHAYRYSDPALERLSAITLISNYQYDFVDAAAFEYKIVQRTWKNRIATNNQQTTKLLDLYFDRMYEAVTKNGKVVVPPSAQLTNANRNSPT